MKDESNPTLQGIAEVLADGMPVDWEGLRDQEPGLADQISRLQALAEVASAYQELRESADPDPEAETR